MTETDMDTPQQGLKAAIRRGLLRFHDEGGVTMAATIVAIYCAVHPIIYGIKHPDYFNGPVWFECIGILLDCIAGYIITATVLRILTIGTAWSITKKD